MIPFGPSYRQAPYDESIDGDGTWWPDGDTFAHRAELPRILRQASSSQIRIALRSVEGRHSTPQLQSAIALGAAVELLAKACICERDPAQIALQGAEDARLLLTGRQAEASKPSALEGLRSIYLAPAVKAAFRLIDEARKTPSIEQLSIARNSAAHMGLVLRHQLRGALHEAVIVCRELLVAYGQDPQEYWGDAAHLAEIALNASKSPAERAVGMREQYARENLERRLELIDLETLRRMSASPTSVVDMIVPIACSVCESSARLEYFGGMGSVSHRIQELDVIDHQEVDGVLVAFNCDVCELHYAGWHHSDDLFDVYGWNKGASFIDVHDGSGWVPRDQVDLTRSEVSRAALAKELGLD